MADCCCGSKAGDGAPRRAPCPGCGGECRSVERRTILQQLREPWRRGVPEQAYWFCGATGCEVAYFGADGATYSVSELRVEVGQKRRSGDAPLCYCYDISYVEAESDPALKRFVIEQTEQKLCSCDSRNPSGRCCLGDFTN